MLNTVNISLIKFMEVYTKNSVIPSVNFVVEIYPWFHFVGCLDNSNGPEQVNSWLSAMNMLPASPSLLKRYERAVGREVEAVAKESCREAIELEKGLTLAIEGSSSILDGYSCNLHFNFFFYFLKIILCWI